MTTKGQKLHALTVCVHYADYLWEVLSNHHHFEDCTVVTCRDDQQTKDLCAAAGLRVIESDYAGPSGACFDSAFAKAPLINEGLQQLPQDGWVVILDADLLLPRNFRQRLDDYDVYPRAL